MKPLKCFQVANEEIQDRRAGGGRPHAKQGLLRVRMEQRPVHGSGQVRTRLVSPITATTPTPCTREHI
jgi:hypothetical protein